eukprot:30017-Pelagococcus_subviridis.AAC.19
MISAVPLLPLLVWNAHPLRRGRERLSVYWVIHHKLRVPELGARPRVREVRVRRRVVVRGRGDAGVLVAVLASFVHVVDELVNPQLELRFPALAQERRRLSERFVAAYLRGAPVSVMCPFLPPRVCVSRNDATQRAPPPPSEVVVPVAMIRHEHGRQALLAELEPAPRPGFAARDVPALFVAVHDAVFVRVSARGAVRVAVSALAEIPGDVVVRLALVPRVILLPPRVLQPARVPLTHAEVEDRVRFQLPRTELFLLVAQLAQLRGVPASEPGRVVLLPLKQLRPLDVVRDSLVLRAHRFGGVHVRGGARRRRRRVLVRDAPREREDRAGASSAHVRRCASNASHGICSPQCSHGTVSRTSSSSSAGWISDGGGSVGGCGGEGRRR